MISGLSRSAAVCSAANVIHREKGVVGLAKADPRAVELLLDEAVTIEVIRGLERQERGDPHDHRAEGFVTDIEIVGGEGLR